MKKINIVIVKILLDISMAVVFALMYNKNVLGGLSFHEIGGLALGFAVFIHLCLNWKWISQLTSRLFGRLTFRARLSYILNVLLLLSFIFIIVSGILISTDILPSVKASNVYLFGRLHVAISYFALILLGIHIGLHRKWLVGILRKLLGVTKESRALGYAVKALIIIAFVFGSYQIYTNGYFSQVSMLVRSSDKEMLFKDGAKAPSGSFGDKDIKDKNIIVRDRKTLPEGAVKPAQRVEGRTRREGAGTIHVLASYLGILTVFAIFTALLDSLLNRRKQPV